MRSLRPIATALLALLLPVGSISVALAITVSAPITSQAALNAAIQSAASTNTLTPTVRAQVLAIDVRNPLQSSGLPLALQQHCFSSIDRKTLSNPMPCIFGNPRSKARWSSLVHRPWISGCRP